MAIDRTDTTKSRHKSRTTLKMAVTHSRAIKTPKRDTEPPETPQRDILGLSAMISLPPADKRPRSVLTAKGRLKHLGTTQRRIGAVRKASFDIWVIDCPDCKQHIPTQLAEGVQTIRANQIETDCPNCAARRERNAARFKLDQEVSAVTGLRMG